MRVAVYTRASTDEAHQPYSLDAQTARLDAYITSQPDWHRVAAFSDRISGATLDRPALNKTLTAARAGRFDLLLVYRVDRLARSVRGLAQILEDLDTAGVAFRSATEPFDTATPAGRMMVQMLGVFAEFERATIIDRVIAGMERKAAKGGWTNGRPPYGYRINGDYLEPDPDEAPLVTTIFDRYTRRRMGTQAIATWLNDRGHRTRAGRRWSHMAVISLLRNRAYIGQIYFRGVHHDAPHQPLVDTDTFDRAQQLLADRGEDVSKRASNSSDYLLGGLITCTRCGKRYVGKSAHGRSYRYRYYTCHTRHRYGTDACDGDRLPAGELDTAALSGVLALFSDRELFARVAADATARRSADRAQREQELDLVDADIAKTEQAMERYLLAFEAGTMPETQCGPRIRDLGAKLADLQHRREQLQQLLDTADPTAPTVDQLADARKHIRDAIDNGDDRHRKQLLNALIAEIRVDSRDSITPVYRVPHAQQVDTVRIVEGQVVRGGVEPPTSRSFRDRRKPVHRSSHQCVSASHPLRIQWVVATASFNFSEGVMKSRGLRGLPLSSAATASRSAWVGAWKSTTLRGTYWRNSPLVFSLLPRCQGAQRKYPPELRQRAIRMSLRTASRRASRSGTAPLARLFASTPPVDW